MMKSSQLYAEHGRLEIRMKVVVRPERTQGLTASKKKGLQVF